MSRIGEMDGPSRLGEPAIPSGYFTDEAVVSSRFSPLPPAFRPPVCSINRGGFVSARSSQCRLFEKCRSSSRFLAGDISRAQIIGELSMSALF